eukprot:g8053.t1
MDAKGGSRNQKPSTYKDRKQHVCGQAGCFECYDIWCERCESKDRRIIELEMRNNELVKHITLLQSKLFPAGKAPSAGGGGSG